MKLFPVYFLLLIGLIGRADAQSQVAECPPNLGFESGNLSGWKCMMNNPLAGPAAGLDMIEIPGGSPRHALFSNDDYPLVDEFGKFSVTPPNGSRYCMKLGTKSTGEVEWTSYTFTVPKDRPFSLVYYYALVMENANHPWYEMPRFDARLFDVDEAQFIACGNFAALPYDKAAGFQISPQANVKRVETQTRAQQCDIYYTPWTTVCVDLTKYAGRTLRLDFNVQDCTKGGHFAYAYVDVDEVCASPARGNTICVNTKDSLVLTAPPGFKEYTWWAPDNSRVIGTGPRIVISPLPNAGTRYPLHIEPFPNTASCAATVYVEVNESFEVLTLNAPEAITVCDRLDITAPALVAGSNSGLKYTYYKDPNLTQLIPNPTKLDESGTYYIKGTLLSGCYIAKPVKLIVKKSTPFTIIDPPQVCGPPAFVDLTAPTITWGTAAGLRLSYWKDEKTTLPVSNPAKITESGTYYIRGDNDQDCPAIVPIKVIVEPFPTIVTHEQRVCGSADLTSDAVTAGSTPGLVFKYWSDAAATIPIFNPKKVGPGVYYISAATKYGCPATATVAVSIFTYQPPSFLLTDPGPVFYPDKVDLSISHSNDPGLTFSYYKDKGATIELESTEVGISGIYYIKATNAGGCSTIKAIKATILPPENPVVTSVNTFTPNGDGVNDYFKLDITGNLRVRSIKVFNRQGAVVFETADITQAWDGRRKGGDVPPGTYYWVFDSFDDFRNRRVERSGAITLIR